MSLTFDDAQATQYQAKQVLADHDMHGTFFVNSDDVCVTDCAGEWNMTWDQLDALAADGNEIGGHTLAHADLTDGTIPLAERQRQVCEDRANLAARGFDPVSFAYPFGHSDATAEDIMGFVAGQVAHYKQVRRLEFIEAVPKSASGKILRRELRAKAGA